MSCPMQSGDFGEATLNYIGCLGFDLPSTVNLRFVELGSREFRSVHTATVGLNFAELVPDGVTRTTQIHNASRLQFCMQGRTLGNTMYLHHS